MTSTLQTIIAGWRQASKVALQALENSALSHVEDEVKFREDLMNIARTTISSKILSQHKDFFAKLAVDAVLRLKGSGNLDAIQIIKIQGGSLEDSFLDAGPLASLIFYLNYLYFAHARIFLIYFPHIGTCLKLPLQMVGRAHISQFKLTDLFFLVCTRAQCCWPWRESLWLN